MVLSDLFAVAALAGAAVVAVGSLVYLPPTVTTVAGASLCFGQRMFAIRRCWKLPLPPQLLQAPGESSPTRGTKQCQFSGYHSKSQYTDYPVESIAVRDTHSLVRNLVLKPAALGQSISNFAKRLTRDEVR